MFLVTIGRANADPLASGHFENRTALGSFSFSDKISSEFGHRKLKAKYLFDVPTMFGHLAYRRVSKGMPFEINQLILLIGTILTEFTFTTLKSKVCSLLVICNTCLMY